jgi:hypothetical protein
MSAVNFQKNLIFRDRADGYDIQNQWKIYPVISIAAERGENSKPLNSNTEDQKL